MLSSVGELLSREALEWAAAVSLGVMSQTSSREAGEAPDQQQNGS